MDRHPRKTPGANSNRITVADWIQELEALLQPEKPGPEWLSVNAAASRFKCSRDKARHMLDRMAETGKAESKLFKVSDKSGRNIVRQRHYRLKV